MGIGSTALGNGGYQRWLEFIIKPGVGKRGLPANQIVGPTDLICCRLANPKVIDFAFFLHFLQFPIVSSMGMVLSTYESKYMSTYIRYGGGGPKDLLDADSRDRCSQLGGL
jgi:hypothetical protein